VPHRFILLALCLIVGAFCARLGFWQLDRLAQRREANDRARAGLMLAAVDATELPDSGPAARFRRVHVEGAYVYEREFALAPRAHQGSPGVHIVTPLARPGTDTLVLIVRGWVYAPDAQTADFERWRELDSARIEGYTLLLDSTVAATGAAPGAVSDAPPPARSVRRLVRRNLEERLGAPVAGYYIVATSEPDSSIAPTSVPVRVAEPSLDGGPHLSYAVQWFLFAIVFGVGGTLVVLKGRPSPVVRG
jgi:surfeit locus 1 family protein